jgi:hypothetical protein
MSSAVSFGDVPLQEIVIDNPHHEYDLQSLQEPTKQPTFKSLVWFLKLFTLPVLMGSKEQTKDCCLNV